jgi:replicative DNA helicase
MSATINLDAEQGVLGSLLLGNRKIRDEVCAVTEPRHFYREANRLIYSAIRSLNEDGKPVDYLTVKEKLGDNLTEAGGEDYIIQVAEFVPSAANGGYYAQLVRECYTRRQVLDRVKKLSDMAKDEELLTDDLISGARELLDGLESPYSPIVNVADVPMANSGDLGVPSGYPGLDRAVSTAGYPVGQTSVVSAYHKAGKTSFMTASALSILDNGGRVLWATFEDLTPTQLKRRMLRQICGWSKLPDKMEYQADYDDAVKILNCHDLDFYDGAMDDHGGTVESFASYAEVQHSKTPYTAIFCDYWQVMSTTKRAWSTEEELKIIASRLNRMARRLNVPVIIGAQITEGKNGAKTVTKGGRSLEEKAGLVLRINRETGEVEIPYSRFDGSGTSFLVTWDKYLQRLVSK